MLQEAFKYFTCEILHWTLIPYFIVHLILQIILHVLVV